MMLTNYAYCYTYRNRIPWNKSIADRLKCHKELIEANYEIINKEANESILYRATDLVKDELVKLKDQCTQCM